MLLELLYFQPPRGLGRKAWGAQAMQRGGQWTASQRLSSRGRPARSHDGHSWEQDGHCPAWTPTGQKRSRGGQRLEADSVVQVLTGSRGPYFGAGEWTTGCRPRSWSQAGPQPAGRPVTGQGWARECDEKGTHRPVMSSRAPGPSFLCSVLQPPAAAGPTSPRGRPAPDHGPRGRPGHLLAV